VFTRKVHTDVSYLACVRQLLSNPAAFFPQFATHNAQSIASVYVAAGRSVFEFQRLHGMGEALYEEVVDRGKLNAPCRVYAPVGPHEDLVSYLVRRLLENGANTSFVNRLADEAAPIEDIIRDPVESVAREGEKPVRRLPRPPEIYAPERVNSAGLVLSEPSVRAAGRIAPS
jgi:RHH-type proline utilization regulon transcriptional repressor/proline dehydrogenase/delta 1-pyrroline-5-carboxylate dehydrogenase